MVHYRRNRVAGGTYFFTVTLRDRRADYLVRYIDDLRVAIRAAKVQYKFTINAMVVLPDHLHAVFTLVEGCDDYSMLWQKIKATFAKRLLRAGCQLNKNQRGEFDLWQSRFWEHTIRDQEDFTRCVDYIHYNPVKHGLVAQVRNWPYSTFHRFVQLNLLSEDWGCGIKHNSTVDTRKPWEFSVAIFD